MPPSAYFILLEGVNVLENIYDTDQLSVIRGSSALFKAAIDKVERCFSESGAHSKGVLKPVSTGASSGLFLVSSGNADDLISAITTLLKTDDGFRHLTFQLVSCEATSLAEALSQLKLKLRVAQLQGFTMLPDDSGNDVELGFGVCELEGRRIVSQDLSSKVQGDKEKNLSISVYARLIHGRDQRQDFYEKELSSQPEAWSRLMSALYANPPCSFAGDFKALCEDKAGGYPRLENKMAVIYIDGNQFGTRQQAFIDHHIKNNANQIVSSLDKEIDAHRAFDKAIKTLRARFLADEIVCQLDTLGAGEVIPLETLMWGGDEMLLVMPAWQGFDFLQRFFAFSWQLEDSSVLDPLTHAAGLVFCQANTPIKIIQKLAYDLAESVKDNYSREKNGWDYLVLESVDYPTSDDLSDYFKQRYSEGLAEHRAAGLPSIHHWVTDCKALAEAKAKNYLSKRQLYQVVGEMMKPPTENASEVVSHEAWSILTGEDYAPKMYSNQIQAEYRLFQVSEDKNWLRDELPRLAESIFDCTIEDTMQRAWLWLHLVELWDYIAVEKWVEEKTHAAV